MPLADPRGAVCDSCGAEPTAGFADCQAMWDHVLAESFSNFAYARFHRQIVDAYSLQHPAQYCKSARSYAAHLTGMCCHMEHDSRAALLSRLQAWLSGLEGLEKPALPDSYGELTVAHASGSGGPDEVASRINEWSRSIWRAYRAQHAIARAWIEQATAGG